MTAHTKFRNKPKNTSQINLLTDSHVTFDFQQIMQETLAGSSSWVLNTGLSSSTSIKEFSYI